MMAYCHPESLVKQDCGPLCDASGLSDVKYMSKVKKDV